MDRYFLVGVLLGVMTGAMFAWAVSAQPIPQPDEPHLKCWGMPPCASWVELGEPLEDGAVATITFENRSVHAQSESFVLEWPPVVVVIDFEWNVDAQGSERLCAYPEGGLVAIPQCITVNEDATFSLHIYGLGPSS